MATYNVHITETVKLIVEVEADSVEEADQKVWSVLDRQTDVVDSDSTIDHITVLVGDDWTPGHLHNSYSRFR